MDIIHQCLSVVPVPYLSPAFAAFRFIWSSVEQVQASKQQLKALTQSVAQLLQTLNDQYRTGRLLETKTSKPLADLRGLLDEISSFVQKEATRGFLKLLFTKDQRISQIQEYHQRIGTSVASFQISGLLNIQAWQSRNENARVADQQELNQSLSNLEMNHQQLKETLDIQQRNMMAMMVSLQRRLQAESIEDREQQFFAHTLRYLTTSSGRQVEMEDWMVTSYEVEFGHEIGSGGFGQVFKGSWKRAPVALKVLVMEDGAAPSSMSIRNEIKVWSNIRHPNILQFLGANVLEEKPFIVMPYLKNGNCKDYLQEHPNGDRLQILYDISLGLVHLHSIRIVHGDLKGLNVLIDDSTKAVLCDFGLSRVKADTASCTVGANEGSINIVGSRYWMAPEQLTGGQPKKPWDVYAFGMTIFEIFANDIPLGHVSAFDFVRLVIEQNIRPERPDDEDAPQLSNEIWELAEKCWVKDPKRRPTAGTVCDTLTHLLSTNTISQPTLSPTHPVISSQFTPRSHAPAPASPPPPSLPPPNLTLQGHTNNVWCATFSPDGRYIVSVSHDKTLIIWDAQTGDRALGPLKRHTDAVLCAAFSPDGRQIASGSRDKTILVWGAATGQVVAGPFEGHTDSVRSVCFSPDGKQIVSGSYDKTVRVWDARTGDLLVDPLTGHTDYVITVNFSRDGNRIVSGSRDQTLRIWDAKSGGLIHGPLQGHGFGIPFAAFSPDGKRIISVSYSGGVCVWDARTGVFVSGPSKRHAEGILAVVFTPNSTWGCAVSPDGKWIAIRKMVGNSWNVVEVWDSKTGQVAGTFSDHIYSITFSPDSKRMLTTSADKTIRVRNINF